MGFTRPTGKANGGEFAPDTSGKTEIPTAKKTEGRKRIQADSAKLVAADAETQSVNLVTSQNIFRLELTPDTYYDPEPPETIGLFNSEEEAKEALAIFIMDKWARQGGVDIAPWGTGSFNEDTLSEEWGEKAVLFARTHSAEKIISTYFDPRANLDIWGDRGWSLRNGYYSYRISIETQYQFRGKLINWERPISRF